MKVSPKDPTKAARMRRWRNKDNMVRVEVRVHPQDRQAVLDYAQELRRCRS